MQVFFITLFNLRNKIQRINIYLLLIYFVNFSIVSGQSQRVLNYALTNPEILSVVYKQVCFPAPRTNAVAITDYGPVFL